MKIISPDLEFVFRRKCLVIVHDVTHHLSMERAWILHMFLEVKAIVMELVFRCFIEGCS